MVTQYSLHADRVKRLRPLLKTSRCDAFVITDATNLYYLTGLSLSAGTFLVHPRGAHLLVDGRYIEQCKRHSPFPVHLVEGRDTLPKMLASLRGIQRLGFAKEHTSYAEFEKLKQTVKAGSKGKKAAISLVAIENPVAALRIIKQPTEIAALKKAAKLGSEGFDFVRTLLQEGITEFEVAQELDIFWKKRGAQSLAFEPIIAFGKNSSMPHYRSGNTRLKKGMPVLIDIGVVCCRYHSDMTRVLFFGKPNPKMEEIYEIVLEAQAAALALCRPGTKIGELDRAAREVIERHGYGDHFTHSLGHGIGLEIHEVPTLRDKPPTGAMPLKPGMAFTIEPGIYLPGTGGVRLEDTIVITEKGHINLTNRPKSLLAENP